MVGLPNFNDVSELFIQLGQTAMIDSCLKVTIFEEFIFESTAKFQVSEKITTIAQRE